METKEYKRKLKSLKAKVLELVLEDFSGCWTKEDACALGYAVKFIQGLTINNDGTISYNTGIYSYNSAMWSAVHTLDKIIQDYNTDIRRRKELQIKAELERIRQVIETSFEDSKALLPTESDIVFLQSHQEEIKKFFPNDADLWQWANIPEEEFINQQRG